MAKGGKKGLGMQEVSPRIHRGQFRGLDAKSQAAMKSPQFSQDLGRFNSIIERAEGMARRSFSLGERGLWSSHPEQSVRWGNLVDEYAKRIFQTSPEGAKLRESGWRYTPRGVRGGDFYHPTLKQVVDPCGLSSSSVRAHRKYLSGGNNVVVRTGGPSGGGKLLNVNAGRAGGLAQLGKIAFDTYRKRDRIADDAALGVAFLPLYNPAEAQRSAPVLSGQTFDPRFGMRTPIFDKKVFQASLERMPVGSKLPLEYPVDRTGVPWIPDVSSRERVNRLSDKPNEFLVWAKKRDGYWHLARSDKFLPKPFLPAPVQPTTPIPRAPWDEPKSWLPKRGTQQSVFVRPSTLPPRPRPLATERPMPWDQPKSWLPGHDPQQSILTRPVVTATRPPVSPRPLGGDRPMPWDQPKSWLPGHGPHQSVLTRPVTTAAGPPVRPRPLGSDRPMPWDQPKSWLPGHGPQHSVLTKPLTPAVTTATRPRALGSEGPMPWDLPKSWSAGHGPQKSFLPRPVKAPARPRPVATAAPMPWDQPKTWLPGHGPQMSHLIRR